MRRMLVIAVLASLVTPIVAQEESERDKKKNAAALYSEALRAETEKPVNLLLAISKYSFAVKHAKDEKNNEVAAASLVHIGWCNEKLDPANIAGAKAAYDEVVSSFQDAKPWGDIAKEKASYKGVDVHLKLLHGQLDAWRVTADRSPLAMAEKKKATADQILAMKEEAVTGLIWGLGHPDEVIRDFSADCIAQITKEDGITAVIAKLNDANPLARAGAGAALQKIYHKYNDALANTNRAQELERDLNTVTLQPGSKAEGQHKKLADEATKLRAKAAEIRQGIPENLATADIQGALQKILEDEGAHAQARREAAIASRSIGRISGGLVDALLKAMDSKDHNVREAACRAAGGVDTSISVDKIKLADRLIKAVQDEPAKAENKAEADWANDEAVRQAAAEALEQIALVKSLPALIEALDDNDSRVRGAAFRALNRITNRDFEYEKDDKGLPKTYEADKPLPDRKKAQEKWEAWWKETQGVVVLVERFWIFQSQWSQGSAVRLFDAELLLKEVESKKWSSIDPKIDENRVKREIEEFKRRKDVFVQDAVDIGVPALDQLAKFIGGETEREPKANAATRHFVAEAMAKIIEKNNSTEGVEKLRNACASGDNAAKKAGGAAGLGFLPKGMVGANERGALQTALGDASGEVKEAAASALGKVGEEGSAADLTRAAGDANQDVQVAALRALSNIKPKNPDTIKALSDMVADEPEKIGDPSKKVLTGAKADQVREWATAALGEIGDPSAGKALLRARRDTAQNVREAATVAIQKVYKADGKGLVAIVLPVFQSEKNKTDDRSGAALLLGDTGEAALGRELAARLIDTNPPRVLRDSDSGVRIQICRALGNLKAKTKSACETGLLKAMADDYEREAVRDAAYKALCAVFGLEPEKDGSADADKKFKASDPKVGRDAAIQKWKEFLAGQGLKDEA